MKDIVKALIVFSVAPLLYPLIMGPQRIFERYLSSEFIVPLLIFLLSSYYFNKHFLDKTDFRSTYLIVNIGLLPLFVPLTFLSFFLVSDHINISKFSTLAYVLAYIPLSIAYILLTRYIVLKYIAFRGKHKRPSSKEPAASNHEDSPRKGSQ